MARKLRLIKTHLVASVLVVAVISVTYIARDKKDLPEFGCYPNKLADQFDASQSLGFFEGKLVRPGVQVASAEQVVLAAYTTEEKWIEVDLSDQTLRAWEGDKVVLQTSVSTGLPWWPTPTGEFRIWIKLRATTMEGGQGQYYYNLPNVPYVMFFENADVPAWKGYGLHGTYWHNDFGRVRSHGCVNLPTEVAGQLFEWVAPTNSGINYSATSTNPAPGTRVVIHE